MTISLIIPTYKRFDCLVDTLNSLMGCEKLPNEVIISDQNDNELFDRVCSEIDRCKSYSSGSTISWKHVYCESIGIAAARNAALARATGDVVIFVDDDILFPRDFFKNVLLTMSNEKIAMIGGVDYKKYPSNDSNFIKKVFLTATGLNGTIRKKGSVSFGIFGKYPSNFYETIPTEWAMGCCMIFRRAFLERSGLYFDEKLTKYGYGEDLEFTHLFYRWCKTNGLETILSPTIGIFHMVTYENRLDKESVYLKTFVNRQYINWVFHGDSITHRFLLAFSNFWYRLVCRVKDKRNDVSVAYYRFLKKRKRLNKGNLDDSCYE